MYVEFSSHTSFYLTGIQKNRSQEGENLNECKGWSRLGDLNPGPSVYDTDALPLS